MNWLTDVNWGELFSPDTPLLEIFIRGTIMYLGLFLLLRFFLKREVGTVGIADVLIIVLLADAAQNGMTGEYSSITDGVILVLTLIFWAYLLNWLGYRFPKIQRLIHPQPLLLIKEGQIQKHNLRKELITKEELNSMLREQGIDDIGKVKEAYMEGDGKISIVSKDKNQHPAGEKHYIK